MGMIGLGRMGTNMVRRLLRGGHQCVVYAKEAASREQLAQEGAIAASSLEDFVAKLNPPRVVWLMIPAGAVDETLTDLSRLMQKGDILIDGGNSYYIDDIRRVKDLAGKGLHYVDVGTSGGVWGLERGYCLMIGGEDFVVRSLDPIFATLAPGTGAASRTPGREKTGGTADKGYLHCGLQGRALRQDGTQWYRIRSYGSLRRGSNILRHANVGRGPRRRRRDGALRQPEHYQYDFNLADITELWRRGA
jgi:6-phosphogluconate dehydrogenase